MTTSAQDQAAVELSAESKGIHKNWVWFLAVGILQVIAGITGVDLRFSESLASPVILGVLLLFAGAAQLAVSVLARNWDGVYLFVLLALVYGVAGLMTLDQPFLRADGLALMLGALFLVVGLFRIVTALVENLPAWRCVLFNGIVALLVGIAMWRRLPAASFGTLGVLVGIELIANGATWSILSLSVRRGVEPLSDQ
jgi:uncharacterized membrane protein HdeD (DUF308 family)